MTVDISSMSPGTAASEAADATRRASTSPASAIAMISLSVLIERLRAHVADEVEIGRKRFWDAHEALITELNGLRAEVPQLRDRNERIAAKMEGLLNRISAAEEDLRTLRAVPDATASSVCIDDDCPFPEHTGDCPPASPQQWEHLARLRGRHINACHQRMMTAYEERNTAVQNLVNVKKSYVEQLSRISMEAQQHATAATAWKNRTEAAEHELTQAKMRLERTQEDHAKVRSTCESLEKRLWQVQDDLHACSKNLGKEQDVCEALAHKLDSIRSILK